MLLRKTSRPPFLALLLVATASRGATFVVDTEVDTMATGCSSIVVGDCSLRGAIERANDQLGLDTITFGFGADTFLLTLAGSGDDLNQTGDLDILEPLTIDGGTGVVIDATGLGDRVLDVLTGVDDFVSLSHVTLRGGQSGGTPDFNGGGLRCVQGAVFLDRASVTGNGPVSRGGGLFGDSCDFVLNYTTIGDNQANLGGGIQLQLGSSLSAPVSAVVGNSAVSGGGGLVVDLSSTADLHVMTVSGNTVPNGVGGSAILASGQVALDYVTLVADPGSGSSAIEDLGGGSFTLSNSVVVGSCEGSQAFVSGGGNLESPGDTCDLDPLVDQIAVADPRLMPLGDYGGATPSHLPKADSPVVDDPLGTITNCPSFDQRGLPRPLDGNNDGSAACDIGAIERDLVFADGFESGDVLAWGASSP